MNEITMKHTREHTATFRIDAREKGMVDELRKCGVDISAMYRNAITSTYCQITGNDNTWGEE
jgi:hypothetical protein